jgi:hypothetical protein
MQLVLYQQDINMYQSETHTVDTGTMKRGYPKLLYGQRNKSETIVSVIKDCLENILYQDW